MESCVQHLSCSQMLQLFLLSLCVCVCDVIETRREVGQASTTVACANASTYQSPRINMSMQECICMLACALTCLKGGCVSGHAALRVFVDCVSRRWVGVCIPACMLAYVFTEYKVRRIHNMEMMSAKTNPRSWAYSSETVCICDGQVLQDCRWRSSISWLFHQGHQNHPFWNESPWSHLICHFQFWTCFFFFSGVCFATTCKTWLPTLKLCHIFLVEASWRVFKKEREREKTESA